MLNFNKIELENFGPYQGKQSIKFDSKGVTVVWGENTYGKTTLLNAFRYALFGKILTRGEKEVDYINVENWEAAEEGTHGFKVALHCTLDKVKYEVNRTCKNKVKAPKSNDDYEEKLYVLKDGTTFGGDDAASELRSLMPEAISRFFLFDGELLAQYEELLIHESAMGDKIKNSIERILDVPVLTELKKRCSYIEEEAGRELAKKKQKTAEGKVLQQEFKRLTAKCRELSADLEASRKDLTKLKTEKTNVETELSSKEKWDVLIQERKGIEDRLKAIEKKRDAKAERLKECCEDSWRWILFRHTKGLRDELVDEIGAIKIAKKVQDELDSLYKAMTDKECPKCKQGLPNPQLDKIRGQIKKLEKKQKDAGDPDDLQDLEGRLLILRGLEVSDEVQLAEELASEIGALDLEEHGLRDDESALFRKIRGVDEKELGKLKERFQQLLGEIPVLDQSVIEQDSDLKTELEAKEKVQQALSKASGVTSKKAAARSVLLKSLYKLVEEGVTVYRDKLKERVEETASKLFRSLIIKKMGDGLVINDQYGLKITSRGKERPVVSSGAAQVVAYSLMGALQNCAPLKGPLVIDSACTRLSGQHRNNFCKTLTSLADQVILLVFKEEIPPESLRSFLKGDLKREYEIQRISDSHSKLVKGR